MTPNHSLLTVMYDDVIGWKPRWVHHLVRATLAWIAAGVQVFFGMSWETAGCLALLFVGIVPHVVTVIILRRYTFDLMDWIADAVMTAGPLALALGLHLTAPSTISSVGFMLGEWLMLYYIVYPYASP